MERGIIEGVGQFKALKRDEYHYLCGQSGNPLGRRRNTGKIVPPELGSDERPIEHG